MHSQQKYKKSSQTVNIVRIHISCFYLQVTSEH